MTKVFNEIFKCDIFAVLVVDVGSCWKISTMSLYRCHFRWIKWITSYISHCFIPFTISIIKVRFLLGWCESMGWCHFRLANKVSFICGQSLSLRTLCLWLTPWFHYVVCVLILIVDVFQIIFWIHVFSIWSEACFVVFHFII